MALNGAAVALGALAGAAMTEAQAEGTEEAAVGHAAGATAASGSSASGSCIGNASKSSSYCAQWKDGSTCIAKGCTWEQPVG